jgi:hypothetical protein
VSGADESGLTEPTVEEVLAVAQEAREARLRRGEVPDRLPRGYVSGWCLSGHHGRCPGETRKGVLCVCCKQGHR